MGILLHRLFFKRTRSFLAIPCGDVTRVRLCLSLAINCILVTAQSFPVQVVPQSVPPAPIYLSNYADASTVNGPLRVQLILNDFTIPTREVWLRVNFEGNGLSFQSNDIVAGANPLFLEGGTPLVLTHSDLAPYFQFENIIGVSPNAYGQALDEGAYQICFEVFDVLTGNRLSQQSCTLVAVFQNDPPLLVLPIDKSMVEERNPQNIVFQWTPRHINVSNVQYELSIVEIWDNQVDPQQAFLSSPPIFQTTTTATTYVYSPADPLLLSGKNYAWRVRAVALQGTEEIGLFENQGYSEIYSFGYSGICTLPTSISHQVKGSTNVNILWEDFTTDIPEFTIRYRQKASPTGGGLEGAEWFQTKTTANYITLWDLKPGTTYEYQVQKTCTLDQSDWSIAQEFTTALTNEETSLYECGITPDFEISNKDPLQNISSGERFKAGDFQVTVTEVSGSNGRFTGKGYVTIPYLNNIKVSVEFTNVLINTEKQLAEGTARTVYDSDAGNILDVDDAVDTVDDIVDFINSISDLFDGLAEVNDSFENFSGTAEEIENIDTQIDGFSSEIDNILNDPTIPQNVKEKVADLYETGGQSFDNFGENPSGPNADGYFNNSSGAFGELQEEVGAIKKNKEALNRLAQAMTSLNGKAFIKCKKCENSDNEFQPIDGEGTIFINALGDIGKYLKCIVGEKTENPNEPIALHKNTQGTVSEDSKTTELQQELAAFINFKDKFLVVAQSSTNLIECQVPLTFLEEHCNHENDRVSNAEINLVTEELKKCLGNTISANDVASTLRKLKDQIRANQDVEYEIKGQIYRLNQQGQPELVGNALTNEQINTGDWSDSDIDLKMRFAFNQDGILQFRAFGIRNSIKNQDGKQINVQEISNKIRAKSNDLLLEYKVSDILKTLAASNYFFDSDNYPDGKKLKINKDVNFVKYFSELGGITTTFIKTTKIEQDVYIDNPKQGQILRGPPVLTGTVEGAAKEVTEITSMVIMVYDVATDEKVRQETVDGFIAIKDKIKDDPSSLYPIVKEVVIEEITGLTPDELANLNVETGLGQHRTSKTSVRTVASILAGGKFLSELPDMALSLAAKIARAKTLRRFKAFDNASGAISKKLDNLGDSKQTFLDDFGDAPDEIIEQIAKNPGLVDSWEILQNTSFSIDIRWLESFDVLKKNDLLKLMSEISNVEITAIHRYTVNNFELTSGSYLGTLTAKQQEWIDLVNSGLDKLRPIRNYQGKVFRGTNRPETEIIQRYVNVYNEGVARGITPRANEPPLLSTSKSVDVAEEFISSSKKPNYTEIMFEINSKRGVDIDDISNYGKNLCPKNPKCNLVQEEVILSNNQDYEILDVIKTTKNDGSTRYIIKLSE
ncbi:fibronectin type III domain-containing protein [Allomuricauda sp. d1]|uniref:fibronectin type III domain-containing protein n=1 Tax=Allomuricauda sp. d1 TaxID=3136725 RepID=UPI0031D8F834